MSRLIWLSAIVLSYGMLARGQQSADSSRAAGQQEDPHAGSPLALVPRSHEEREAAYRAEHRIVLTVRVADSTAKPVPGLQQEDFSLLANGKPIQILDFKRMDDNLAPVTLFLLVDGVNNSAQRIATERKGIDAYFSQNGGRLQFPTTIGLMTDHGIVTGEATRDGVAASADLLRLTKPLKTSSCTEKANVSEGGIESGGAGYEGLTAEIKNSRLPRIGQCLNERFKASLTAFGDFVERLEKTPGRVLLVMFGAGWSTLEGPQFAPDTRAASLHFYEYLAKLQTSLLESQVTLSSIFTVEELRDAGVTTEEVDGLLATVPTPATAHARDLAVQALAFRSGGLVIAASRDIAGSIAKCAADGASYYSVSFDSPPAESPGEFHALKIASKAGLVARTATGYFAEP